MTIYMCSVVGAANRCSRRGPYQTLRSKEKRVFRSYRYVRSEAQLPLMPKTPDLVFFVATTTDIWTN